VELVQYTIDGAVALIRLDRPPVNALSAELSAELLEAFTMAEDPAVRAVVVTGQPHFAAGADIKGFQAAYDSGRREGGLASSLAEAVRKLEQLRKPVIAAVHGYALGGGLELAMGADFRYLAEDAKVGQPEILLGIIPGAGGTQRLPRIVGFQKAKELNYSGRHIDAEEALTIGLADEVFPTDEVLDRALAAAAEYAQGPTVALGAARRAMNEGWGKPIDEAMAVEAAAFDDCFWSEDAKEGVAAFIGKRKADFQGR
jgi:enoyl-CoA hydratase/carnithine racemase